MPVRGEMAHRGRGWAACGKRASVDVCAVSECNAPAACLSRKSMCAWSWIACVEEALPARVAREAGRKDEESGVGDSLIVQPVIFL